MKTSAYLGKNIGTLPFTHFSTLKRYGNKSSMKLESDIKNLFNNSPSLRILNFNTERGCDDTLHSHILLQSDIHEALIEDIKAFIKPYRIEEKPDRIICKMPKGPYEINTGVAFKDQWVNTTANIFTGKKMSLYVVKVVGTNNASQYSNKFNDYGLSNGFYIK